MATQNYSSSPLTRKHHVAVITSAGQVKYTFSTDSAIGGTHALITGSDGSQASAVALSVAVEEVARLAIGTLAGEWDAAAVRNQRNPKLLPAPREAHACRLCGKTVCAVDGSGMCEPCAPVFNARVEVMRYTNRRMQRMHAMSLRKLADSKPNTLGIIELPAPQVAVPTAPSTPDPVPAPERVILSHSADLSTWTHSAHVGISFSEQLAAFVEKTKAKWEAAGTPLGIKPVPEPRAFGGAGVQGVRS